MAGSLHFEQVCHGTGINPEIIIGYWRLAHEAYPNRFGYEAAGMTGKAAVVKGRTAAQRGTIPTVNWEPPLCQAFCEAVETTAIRRGAERWEG